uniref:DUF1985 domain-containing protein n=1 Tax=Brassica oleracea var. oleracea TaxID=109376 RepID=A0A0D3CKB6_BRAOL
MSSRKGSSKRNSSSHSSSGDSSANEVIAPKEEFEVEEEEKDAYYKALCDSPPPSQDIPIPKRPVRSPNAPLTLSMVSPDYLTTLKDFFTDLPPGFTTHESLDEESRRKVVAEGSSLINRHWLGVLISSYELGMDLNLGNFEGFWFTRGMGIDGSYHMAPKKGMAIIQGHTSHPKTWFDHFFFVRIDGESVEESYLHLFRREWNFTRVNRILPPTPADLFAKRDLLRSRPFFWNSFTVERIQSAVELHRSRAVSQPLDIPYDVEPGMRVFNAALDGIFRESLISHFKAEEAERELFRFWKEVEEQSWTQAELHSLALVRAERRGKRAIVAEMKRRAALFATEFESFKDAQEFVGDFRECRGSVATLYKSQNENFSFPTEVAEMSGLMNGCGHAESLVPPIEGRVRQLWDFIEVSEDMAEAGTGVGDEGAGVADGEVDQPASSFGISMSGFLDFEL